MSLPLEELYPSTLDVKDVDSSPKLLPILIPGIPQTQLVPQSSAETITVPVRKRNYGNKVTPRRKSLCILKQCGCNKVFTTRDVYDHLLPKIAKLYPNHPAILEWEEWEAPLAVNGKGAKGRVYMTRKKQFQNLTGKVMAANPRLADLRKELKELMNPFFKILSKQELIDAGLIPPPKPKKKKSVPAASPPSPTSSPPKTEDEAESSRRRRRFGLRVLPAVCPIRMSDIELMHSPGELLPLLDTNPPDGSPFSDSELLHCQPSLLPGSTLTFS